MLEKDFYKKVEIIGYLKHIIYGDSVTEYTKTPIRKKGENNFSSITFSKLWNWLIKIGLKPVFTNNKYYIHLKNEFTTISYDSINDKFIESTPTYIMRHHNIDKLIRLKINDCNYIEVTKNHSLLDYNFNTREMTPVDPENCQTLFLVNNKNCCFTRILPNALSLPNNIKNIKLTIIKEKEYFNYNGYVYDFCVPTTQNFIANGFLVHNTDSIFILIPIDPKDINITPEEKWKKVKFHTEEINKRIINYSKNYFLPRCNIPPEENRIYFKSELLMSQGIFLDVKKNYAYRLLMKEGTPANGVPVYTGIPVVKSDAAKLTQDMIRYYVEEVALTNKSVYEKIEMLETGSNKFKTKFYENLKNLDLDDITFPGKWAKKEIVIFGMKLYNTIMGEEIFSPGSSGRYIYCIIKNPIKLKGKLDISEINSETITIPYNYDKKLLEKKMQEYGIIFDGKTQWEKLNITTIDRIFETIKKQFKDEVGEDVI